MSTSWTSTPRPTSALRTLPEPADAEEGLSTSWTRHSGQCGLSAVACRGTPTRPPSRRCERGLTLEGTLLRCSSAHTSLAHDFPPEIIAVGSGKGGVGKTLISIGIGDVLARRGYSTAVLDLDPQAGATLAVHAQRPANPLVADPDRRHSFALYPASRALALASVDELQRRVQAVGRTAKMVLVDLSPALTDASHAAVLPVASLVLVVARTDAAGLSNVEEMVGLCREYHREFLVVPNMYGRTRLAAEAHALLQERYAPNVASSSVPLEARAAEAAGVGLPVTSYAPTSSTAQALESIAGQVVDVLAGFA